MKSRALLSAKRGSTVDTVFVGLCTFYEKVDSHLELDSRSAVQSRDFSEPLLVMTRKMSPYPAQCVARQWIHVLPTDALEYFRTFPV